MSDPSGIVTTSGRVRLVSVPISDDYHGLVLRVTSPDTGSRFEWKLEPGRLPSPIPVQHGEGGHLVIEVVQR